MTPPFVQLQISRLVNSVWFRAATLVERLPRAHSQAVRPEQNTTTAAEQPPDSPRLRYAMRSWTSQAPFQDGEHFRQRLILEGLTERDLRAMIAEEPDAIRRRVGHVPAWVAMIEAVLSAPPSFEFRELLTERLRRQPDIGFLDAAAPFITFGISQLEASARRLGSASARRAFDLASVTGLFFPTLARGLQRMLARTLALELNVARVEGTLTGRTAKDRFESFVVGLRQPHRLQSLYREYPVLARLLAEHVDRWVHTSIELLERVVADFDALASMFSADGTLGPLVRVSGGLADPHHGGRSVAMLRFGDGTRIVYKPKSLAVDTHFQQLLQWVTAKGFSPAFRTLTILDRGDYGWVEHVSPDRCEQPKDVARFYERAGGLLAVLYAAEATDLHAGNVIASGEHPMLIDLEALFHPHRSPCLRADVASADEIADRWIQRSVLRLGLLPEPQWGDAEHGGVDRSGLGAPAGQLTLHPIADWEQAGTDTMHLVRRRKPIEDEDNHPTVGDRPVDVLDFRSALLHGFRTAYGIMADHREELVAADGPLPRFSNDSISVFLRSSRTYRRLLRESYHPDVLRDALDRDRLFDRLWAEVPGKPHLRHVIASERADLWRGDIPQFTARPGSRTLWFGAGDQQPDFFSESSMTSALRIIERLSPEDCERQAWMIDASLASLPGALARRPSVGITRSPRDADSTRLLAAASAIGDRLEALAMRGRDDAAWIGLDLIDQRSWTIATAGLDLDAGVPGIALFLAYLGAITGRDAPTRVAEAAVGMMHTSIAERLQDLTSIGAFDGLGGMIYALSHVAVLWGRADLADEAEALAQRLPGLIEEDDALNVYAGSAGCILSLRSLAVCRPTARVREAAEQCGRHLIRSAQRTASGLVWLATSEGVAQRAGLAFGNAGIAWALAELHAWTRDERFREAAAAGLNAERARLRQAHAVDTRHEASRGRGPAAHGDSSPGAWCDDEAAVAWAALAISGGTARAPGAEITDVAAVSEALQSSAWSAGHCLCHGDLGRIELLRRAASILADSGAGRDADRRLAAVLEEVERSAWRCGTPLEVETPGLLAGLAGIGYGLLRAATPERVPSVLTLEVPHAGRG